MIDTSRVGPDLSKKTPAPYEKRVNTLVTISETEVNRIIREYARSLNLRGYPNDEEKINIEIDDTSWIETNSCVGKIHVRFTEV